MRQRTLAAPFEADGIGLHGGRAARVRVEPAPVHHGLQIAAVDQAPFRATIHAVSDTRLGTWLGFGSGRVGTVEHWLAALSALGVDNATLRLLAGDELPVLDGSARLIVARVRAAGLVEQPAPRRFAVVRRPVEARGPDGAFARLEPAPRAELAGTFEFRAPVGRQEVALALTAETFARDLAPARTFGFLEDVDALWRAKRGLGGAIDNALVYGREGPVNPGGARFSDECARHKLLDAIGDLALLGAPWVGRYVTFRGGHRLNVAVVTRALCTPGAIRFVTREAVT